MAQLAKVFTGDGVVGGERILSISAIQQMAADETATTLKVGPHRWRRLVLLPHRPGPEDPFAGIAVTAWQARVGKKWVLANESPQSLNWVGAPAVEIAAVPGLSGYLLAQGALVDSVPFDATTSDTRGSMFLEIPVGFCRDTVSGQSD